MKHRHQIEDLSVSPSVLSISDVIITLGRSRGRKLEKRVIPGSPQSCKVEFLRVKPENLFFCFKLISFYFCLCWVFVALSRLSLVVASQGYSLVAVLDLLIAVASLVAEHGL